MQYITPKVKEERKPTSVSKVDKPTAKKQEPIPELKSILHRAKHSHEQGQKQNKITENKQYFEAVKTRPINEEIVSTKETNQIYNPDEVVSLDLVAAPIYNNDLDAEPVISTSVEAVEPEHIELAPELTFVLPSYENEADQQTAESEGPRVLEQVQERINTLQPEVAQEATAILDVVVEKLQEIVKSDQELSDLDEGQREELELYTARLLTCLGIEPSKKNINQFLDIMFIEQKQIWAELPEITDEGTHEIKSAMSQLFDDIGAFIHPSMLILGKYAMALAAIERSNDYMQE